MFAALKSLLSVHVAPGGSYVNYAPFSFAWFTRPTIRANAGDDAIERAELKAKIEESLRMLYTDNLVGGRDLLQAAYAELVKE